MILPKTLCFVAARNIGDITIMSKYFRQLVAHGVADRYVVWTRPSVAFLFEGIPDCTVVCSNFPVGTNRAFGWSAAVEFMRAALRVRRHHPTFVLDYVGDFRERLFSRLAGGRRLLHIGWAQGHAYGQIIRNPFGDGHPAFIVQPDIPNVYAAYQAFTDWLISTYGRKRPVSASDQVARRSDAASVGLHPFASQDCRKWPQSSWTTLAAALLEANLEVVAFGAPAERGVLETMFGEFGDRVRIVTDSIPQFMHELSKLQLMVGLDSFSIHMAERVGTDSVFINGANDPTLFSPPHALVLRSSGGCQAWPCYNRPSCVGSTAEYVCIRSINVERVCEAVADKLLAVSGTDYPSLRASRP